MTPPTPSDANVTRKYIRLMLPGLEQEMAPVKAVMSMVKKNSMYITRPFVIGMRANEMHAPSCILVRNDVLCKERE